MSSNRPLPLHTKSLILRQPVPGDARDLFVLCREEQYRTWLPSQVYDDEAHAQQVVEYLVAQCSDPGDPQLGPYVLVIQHRADRAIIGHVGFSPIDDDVEIGFAIGERYQGRGLAVEAVVAASRWAFNAFNLERILGIADTANTASRRTLVRAGLAHQEDKNMTFQGTEQSVSIHALSAEEFLNPSEPD